MKFNLFGLNKPIIGIKEAGIGTVVGRSDFFNRTGVDSEKQSTSLQQMYDNAYLNFPLVAAGIDITVEQVVQEFHFEGPNKKATSNWGDKVNAGQQLSIICKHMLKNGGHWVEMPSKFEMKHLDPKSMTIHRERTGKIIGHSQSFDDTKKVLWGSTGSSEEDKKFAKKSKLDKIVYFPFNRQAGDKYGTSIIHSVLDIIQLKESMERDFRQITRRYAAPIIHAKVGDETHMPSNADITNIKSQLDDIHADTEYVTNHLVDLKVLEFADGGGKLEPMIKHMDSNIIAGLQVPPELLGVEAGAKGSAEMKLRSFGRHIKSIQRQLKTVFEDEVLVKRLGFTLKDKLMFAHAEEREQEIAVDQLRGLVKDGLITPQKANDLLPPSMREKLPKEMKLSAATATAAASAMQSREMIDKGPDAMKGPGATDPTMKQKEPNQSRNKTDRASTSKPATESISKGNPFFEDVLV